MSKERQKKSSNTQAQPQAENVQTEVKQETVSLLALENTYLANGTFVRKGETVKVSREYADRVTLEKNKSFIIKK